MVGLACHSAPPAPSLGAVTVEVGAEGYHPEEIGVRGGEVAHLVFLRNTDKGCGTQVVFPTLGITKDLPLGQPVPIDVTMPTSGRIAFTCGMGMYKGALIAK